MRHFLLNNSLARTAQYLFMFIALAALTACGGGGGGANPFVTPTSAVGATAAVPTVTLTLINASGVATTTVAANTTVAAIVKNDAGVAVQGAIVTFTTNTALTTITPTNATALTNANGIAMIRLDPIATGAGIVSASALVTPAAGGAQVTATGSASYATQVAAGGVVLVPTPTLALVLTQTGVTTSNVTNNTLATATITDANGAPVVGTVVTFATNTALATIAPAAATALTNASGVATVSLNAVAAGATTLTASAQIPAVVGGAATTVAVSGSVGYSTTVGAVQAPTIAMTAPVFGVSGVPPTLSALGNTSVTVTVTETLAGGVPTPIATSQTVTFTSNCATTGKAILTPTAITVNGIATASYRDMGCASTDTITAAIAGGLVPAQTANLVVTPPSVGSIQYVSATPLSISLKGMGGIGRQETAQVVFRVVDAGGLPVAGNTVSFALNTTVGGITLSTPSAISDALGQVYVTVNAGTISTPVRVTASVITAPPIPLLPKTLTTQSDQLTISTGIPDQQNFGLVASIHNIEGWNIEGAPTVITARLADHFGNPVLDGTTVNFTCEGGCTIQPSCNTVAGTCSVTLTSLPTAIATPNNGRVTVLAYAVGEEGFIDANGNGMVDQGRVPSEMLDPNAKTTDIPEAWVDYDESGTQANLIVAEPFFDFVADGLYTAADGLYNGVLCDHTLPTLAAAPVAPTVACSTKKTVHVFKQLVVVLSGSHPIATLAPLALNLRGCTGVAAFVGNTNALITDLHTNLMPAGTIIAVSTTNGKLTTPASYIVQNSTATNIVGLFANAPDPLRAPYALQPSPPVGTYPIWLVSDHVITPGNPAAVPPTLATCTDPTPNGGALTVTITTPGAAGIPGTVTAFSIPVTDL